MLRLRFGFRPFRQYVQSKANVADLPSRGEFTSLIAMGASWVVPRLPTRDEYRRSLSNWLPSVFRRRASRAAPQKPRPSCSLRRKRRQRQEVL